MSEEPMNVYLEVEDKKESSTYEWRSDDCIQAAMDAVIQSGEPFNLSLSPADYAAVLYALRHYSKDGENDVWVAKNAAEIFDGMISATGTEWKK